jgi:hypothetical protein
MQKGAKQSFDLDLLIKSLIFITIYLILKLQEFRRRYGTRERQLNRKFAPSQQ